MNIYKKITKESSTADLHTVMVLSYLLCPCHIYCQYFYDVVTVWSSGQLLYWQEGNNVYISFAFADQNMKRGEGLISLTGLNLTHFYIVITCIFFIKPKRFGTFLILSNRKTFHGLFGLNCTFSNNLLTALYFKETWPITSIW